MPDDELMKAVDKLGDKNTSLKIRKLSDGSKEVKIKTTDLAEDIEEHIDATGDLIACCTESDFRCLQIVKFVL